MLLTLALLACSDPPPPPRAAAPAAPAEPTAPRAFDCGAWTSAHHMEGAMCSESPHLAGLWLVQPRSGGLTQFLAIRDGAPLKGGGGAAVAAFLRASEPWAHPVTVDDVGGVLVAFGAYPPGFERNTPASFEAPFTYRLTTPIADWSGHGGANAVVGASPTGPMMRATLTGGPDAPIQWVIESGSGADWAPTATIQWDRGPKP